MKTRHWILYLFVWIAFFLTLFLTSCRTKTVTQDHFIKDTSVSKGLDLTWQERFVAAFEQMAQVRCRRRRVAIGKQRIPRTVLRPWWMLLGSYQDGELA